MGKGNKHRENNPLKGFGDPRFKELLRVPDSDSQEEPHISTGATSAHEPLPSIEQGVSTDLTFASLGIKFSGVFTEERLEREIIPAVASALAQAGFEKEDIDLRLGSFAKLNAAKRPSKYVIEDVQRILHNLNYEVTASAHKPKAPSVASTATATPRVPTKKSADQKNQSKDAQKKKKDLRFRKKIAEIEEGWHTEVDEDKYEFDKREAKINALKEDQKLEFDVWKNQYLEWNSSSEHGEPTRPLRKENAFTGGTDKKTSVEEESDSFLKDIDFDDLETSEGRKNIFRTMVGYYNFVRNKRDELGFEGRKNVKNAELDGYIAFRRTFLKLRKKIGELSRALVSEVDEKGKVLEMFDGVELEQAYKEAFAKDFGFLKNYYERIQAFTPSEENNPQDKKVIPESVKIGNEYTATIEEKEYNVTISRITDKDLFVVSYIDGIQEKTYTLSSAELRGTGVSPKKEKIPQDEYAHSYTLFTKEGIDLSSRISTLTPEQAQHIEDRISSISKESVFSAREPISQLAFSAISLLVHKGYTREQVQRLFTEKIEPLVREISALETLVSGIKATGKDSNEREEELSAKRDTFRLLIGSILNSDVPGVHVREKTEPIPEKVTPPSTTAERLVVRNEWRENKNAYEAEYKKYYEDEAKRKETRGFLGGLAETYWPWRKSGETQKSQEFVDAELKYNQSRKKYAEMLNEAIEPKFRAALANRFVIAAAEKKISLETEALEGVAKKSLFSRMSDSVKELTKKYPERVKVFGLAAVGGLSLATGGIGGLILAGGVALTKETLKQAGLASLVPLSYGAAGGAVGFFVSENDILHKETRRDDNNYKSRFTFSPSTIEALESDSLLYERAVLAARKRKGAWVTGGAAAGTAFGLLTSGDASVDVAAPDPVLPLPVPPPEITPPVGPVLPSAEGVVTPPTTPTLEVAPKEVVKSETFAKTPGQVTTVTESVPAPKTDFKGTSGGAGGETELLKEPKAPKGIDRFPFEEDVVAAGKSDGEFSPPPDSNQEYIPVESPEPHEPVETLVDPAESEYRSDIEEGLDYVPYTLEEGDSVSKAFCEVVSKHKNFLDVPMSPTLALEFLTREMEDLRSENPELYASLMEDMEISSGNLDDVKAGQIINLAPLFEHLNTKLQ